MNRGRGWSWATAIVLTALASAAIWKVQSMARADRLAAIDPAAALAIEPGHATALASLSRAQLKEGRTGDAAATARRLLREEPLAPTGWTVLAEVAARAQGDTSSEAIAAARIALRHAPRDLAARARLTEAAMARRDFTAAMVQLDVMLRLSRPLRSTLLPALLQQAAVPGFRDALAATLARDPTWRAGMLAEMATHIDRPEVRSLYGALRTQGGLSPAETTRWLDALIAKGHWGAAYAHWASTLDDVGKGLPAVYNGDFEQPLSDSGFDWRLRKVSGSAASREPRKDDQGHAARIAFQGRKIERAGLEQALLLPPGRHRVEMQVRAGNLRSEQGLEWIVQCANGKLAGHSEPLQGNFEWRAVAWDVVVPVEGCPGQWLRLRNPAPAGTARITRGDLWVDEVIITRH